MVKRLLWIVGVLLLGAIPARAERLVRVVVAADEEFRARAGWVDDAINALARAGDEFAPLGIQFTIDRFEDWVSDSPDYDLAALHRELERKVALGSGDLILGLVGRVSPTSERRLLRLGHSDTPGPVLVVSDRAGPGLSLIVRHELGHSFGVPHVVGAPSIMNEEVRARNSSFDPVSAAIIRNNAGLNFRDADPLASCRLEPLHALYQTLEGQGAEVADLIAVIGDSHRIRREYSDAARAYREAQALDPDLLSARLGLGDLALKSDDAGEAIRLFESVREVMPDIDGLDTSLGLAYSAAGERAKAIVAYRRALEDDPADASAMNNLALLYIDDGRYNEAETLLLEAIARDDRPIYRANLALLLRRTGRETSENQK